DLIKQSGNFTVTLQDAKGNFLGNGIIVTSDGLILTSNALLLKLTEATAITNDGQKLLAAVKERDTKTGIAVLDVAATNLPTVQFDDAASLSAGQRLIYIGRGNVKFEHEAVTGFLTQSLANQIGINQITTDAALSPDYYGGPIVNLSGHVVGLTTGNS